MLPSTSPRDCSNSCPLSHRCHPPTSSSAVPFSSYLQSFPASGSFQMNQLFASGGHSYGASALASVLPMNIQGWFLLGLSDLISLQSKILSRVFTNTTVQKHQFISTQPSLWSNSLFFQGARVFYFHGCSQHLQWFWSQESKLVTVSFVSPSVCRHQITWS